MAGNVEQRITGIAERVLDNYLDLFAVLLAEEGVEPTAQEGRIARLVRSLQSVEIAQTIFDNGRRIATRLNPGDPPTIEVNAELFGRVSDSEVMVALARPIAELLEITPLSVALLFQTTDERTLRDLATRAKRSSKTTAIRPVQIKEFVTYRSKRFTTLLNGVVKSSAPNADPISAISIDETFDLWPDWVDVRSKPFAKDALEWAQNALTGTEFENVAETVVGLCWESLSLTPNSFIRHAARELRSDGAEDVVALLRMFVEVIGERQEVSLHLKDWPNYVELFSSYKQLVKRERQLFGSMWGADDAELNMVQPARDLLGLEEPADLPWDFPIVSWSVREANAARDLMTGLQGSLHTSSLNPFFRDDDVPGTFRTDDQIPVGVRIIANDAKIPSYDHHLTKVAYASVQRHLLAQFDRLEIEDQIDVVTTMRKTLDDLFPQAAQVWDRRFHNWLDDEVSAGFARLLTTFQGLTGLPLFYDPFGTPGSATGTKYPGLMLTVGVKEPPFEISIGVPVYAILATAKAGPLRVRVVAVDGEDCRFLADRPLHIAKISELQVEQVLRSIVADAIKLSITAA